MQTTLKNRWRVKETIAAAEAYTHRKRGKHDSEMKLISKAVTSLTDVASFLDAPCGAGRAMILLQRLGYKTAGVDLGDGAIAVAEREMIKRGMDPDIKKANLVDLPFAENSFDAVLCFRFFHHLANPEIRERIVAELCRVADKYVLISYFSPFSVTSIKRVAKKKLWNETSSQFATSLAEVEGYFSHVGFELLKDYPQRQFFHTLHLAVFGKNKRAV